MAGWMLGGGWEGGRKEEKESKGRGMGESSLGI